MKAYMTNGTVDFLEKLVEKHSHLTFHIMDSATSSLAYYEGTGKSIFESGRDYDIIIQSGQILEEGFVVMNNIPLTEEGKPVFEHRFKQRQGDIDSLPGFQAFRLLKPTKGNTYVVFTQWASKEDYEAWRDSEDFVKSHKNPAVKPPAYFAYRPFITTYSMSVEEEE